MSASLIGENPHADELAPIRMFSPELDFLWVAEFRRNRFDRRLTSSGISQFRREKSFLENIAAQYHRVQKDESLNVRDKPVVASL